MFTVTDGGFAKRTHVAEYRQQGRGGLGIKAMKLNEDRGSLVGGLVVTDNDEVIAIKASGQITRSAVAEVPVKGRDTMGVKFVGVGDQRLCGRDRAQSRDDGRGSRARRTLRSGSAPEDEAPTAAGAQPESAEVGEDDSE